MIVLPDGDGVVLFRQEAHAQLAGELAARIAAVSWERSAFVAAARVHDNGWREADAAPTLDGDGRPHTFYAVPPEVTTACGGAGSRAAAVDALVGLLVGLHGARFFGTNPHAQVRALHDEERERQDLLGELGLGASWRELPSPISAASDWIAFLDRLSLTVCGELADSLTTEVDGLPYRTTRAADVITVDPWPFTDDGVEVTIDGHRLPHRAFASEPALREALDTAPAFTRCRVLQPT